MKLHTVLACLVIALSAAASADDVDMKTELRAEADAQKRSLEQGEATLLDTLLSLEVIRAKSALLDAGLAPQDVQSIGAQLQSDFEPCLRDISDIAEDDYADSLFDRWEQVSTCNAAAYERAGLNDPRRRDDYESPTFSTEPRIVTPDELLEDLRTLTQ